MGEELNIAAADRDRCVATWRNFLFSIRSGEQTLENIRLQATLGKTLTMQYPAGIGLMIIYEPSAQIPDRACRKETVRRFNEFTSGFVAVTVLDAPNIKTTVLRTIIKSIAALLNRGRERQPRALAGSVSEGATFLLNELHKMGAPTVPVEQLLEIIHRMREGQRQLLRETE